MAPDAPAIPLTARFAGLDKIAKILSEQQGRKLDVVANAAAMRFEGTQLIVNGVEAEITDDGVQTVDGIYQPTEVFDEGLAEKLGVPRAYVRRMRNEAPDLYDANANGWLHGHEVPVPDASGNTMDVKVIREPDTRKFMLRLFRGDDGVGVGRAMLSDSYRTTMDHLDVLTAALQGVQDSGADAHVTTCDLSERRMTVTLEAPGVRMLAPLLLTSYRSPFADPTIQRANGWSLQRGRAAAGREGKGFDEGAEPIVWAGFRISNSETGDGAFNLNPLIKVRVCDNGLVILADSLRKVHLGSRHDAGVVAESADTQRKELAVVAARTRDAVQEWLNPEWLAKTVAWVEEKAGIRVADPAAAVETVTRKLGFTEAERAGVLAHFVAGGQLTAGGVMQAVSSFAQTVDSPDRAYDIERAAVQAMELAAAL
jgi:hypothetical protein